MNEEAKTAIPHPFTPRGVARLATARFSRLLLASVLVALVVGGTVIWFGAIALSPVITAALSKFPDGARIESGELQAASSGLLADGRFLSVSVELEPHSESGTGHIQVKLWNEFFEICSLFGCSTVSYPKQGFVDLGYSTSGPWWGAWQRAILVGVGVSFAIFLLVTWSVLALIYIWPVRLIAYFFDRELRRGTAWRLSVAAQLPGAIFTGLGIILFGSQALDLVGFIVWFLLHFAGSWTYLLTAPIFLSRMGADPRSNPFTGR